MIANLFHNIKFKNLQINYSVRQSFQQVEFLQPRMLKSDQKSDHYQGNSGDDVEQPNLLGS